VSSFFVDGKEIGNNVEVVNEKVARAWFQGMAEDQQNSEL
jgi:hypothetical protein